MIAVQQIMASRQDYGSSNFQGVYLHSEDLMHILRRHRHVKWRYALEAVGNSNRFRELDCKICNCFVVYGWLQNTKFSGWRPNMRSVDFWFYEIEVSLVEDQIWLWILVWYDLIFLPNIPSVTASPGGTCRYIHTWLEWQEIKAKREVPNFPFAWCFGHVPSFSFSLEGECRNVPSSTLLTIISLGVGWYIIVLDSMRGALNQKHQS